MCELVEIISFSDLIVDDYLDDDGLLRHVSASPTWYDHSSPASKTQNHLITKFLCGVKIFLIGNNIYFLICQKWLVTTLSMKKTLFCVVHYVVPTLVFTRMPIVPGALVKPVAAAWTWNSAANHRPPACLVDAVVHALSLMDAPSWTFSARPATWFSRPLFPATRKYPLLFPFVEEHVSPRSAAASRLVTSRQRMTTMFSRRPWNVIRWPLLEYPVLLCKHS